MNVLKAAAASVIALIALAGCAGYSCPSQEKARQAIMKIVPVQFDIVEIKRAPQFPCLCETVVITAGKQPIVLYLDKDARYVLSGSLIEIESRKNLTLEKQNSYKK